MTSALQWFGEAVAVTFLAWLFLAVAHQHRLDRTPRCPACHRPFCSPLDLRMHTFDCRAPARGSQPTRRHRSRRVGTLDHPEQL